MKVKLCAFKAKIMHLFRVVNVQRRIGARGVCFIVACIHLVINVHNFRIWAVQQYSISMFWLWAKKYPAWLLHQL